MTRIVVGANNLRVLVHTLTRLDVLGRGIHVAYHLNVSKNIFNSPINIVDLNQHHKVNAPNLLRLVKFLSCYKIFQVVGEEVSHSELSIALNDDSLLKSVYGYHEDEWNQLDDLLNFLNHNSIDSLMTLFAKANFECNLIENTFAISAVDPQVLIRVLANIQFFSKAIYSAAYYQLPDLIYDKPQTAEYIAEKLNQKIATIQKWLGLLQIFNLITLEDNKVILSRLFSALLSSSHQHSIRLAVLMANTTWNKTLGKLLYSIETGKSSYIEANQQSFFDYLESHSDHRLAFDRGLANFDFDNTELITDSSELNLKEDMSIVDLAGGNGEFLTCLMHKEKITDAILIEQPKLIAKLKSMLDENYLQDDQSYLYLQLIRKCQLIADDILFFSEETKTKISNKDIYFLKGVLHDFSDEDCLKILKNISSVMSKKSSLKIIERSLNDDNKPHANKITDMQMMMFFASKEREVSHYKILSEKAGIYLREESHQIGDYTVMTGVLKSNK